MTQPAMYTVRELADRWRLKPKTIQRWIAGGAINALIMGNDYRIKADEVERLEGLMEQGRFM